MSHLKQPVVGEKPFCPKHPSNAIDWTCAAGSCSYRALCQECLTEHRNHYPHHCDQISSLNDWYKQYKRISKNFDPRESYQMTYHMEEVGMILKKEKYELEKIAKTIDDSFEGAINVLSNKLKSLKENLHDYLWRDFNMVHDDYNVLVKRFSDLQKFNPRDDILEAMKKDLQKYFAEKNLKEYFDRVYGGYYDEMIFNTRLDSKEMIKNLKTKRRVLGEGFNVFDQNEFGKRWVQEVERLVTSIESNYDDIIFKKTKLDFLNPKSPKLMPTNNAHHSARVTGLSSLEDLSSSFISKVDDGLLMTISDQRVLTFLDPDQNFRALKRFTLGEELISSIEFLYLDTPTRPSTSKPAIPFLLVLGGNDDHPALEVWDCLRNERLKYLENVHEYGISCLKTLKKEKVNQKQLFYVASGSADGFIKLWQIAVSALQHTGDSYEDKVEVELLLKVCAHDSFISSIVSIPACTRFPLSLLISGSHDKSLYIWEWEKHLESRTLTRNNGLRLMQEEEDDEEDRETYGRKMTYAHSDRINGILLLCDRPDYSDLEYYATGGGEGLVKVWRLNTGEMVKTFSNRNNSPIFSMEYLQKNRIACTANEVYLKRFFVLVWNWKTASLLLCIKDHQTRVYKISSLSEGMFATCDKSKTIKLWQLEEDSEGCQGPDNIENEVFAYGNGLLDK